MELSDSVKEFLKQNSNLVKNREWDKLFEEWGRYVEEELHLNALIFLNTRYLSQFLISCAGMRLTQLKMIYPDMFNTDSTIQTIHIPGNIEKICDFSFSSSSLSDIQIDEGLQIIDADAIRNTQIEKIKLPKSLNLIGNRSIGHNPNLGEVWIQGNPYITQTAFEHCPKLSKIYLVGATPLRKEDLALNLIPPNESFNVEKDIVIV